MKHNSYECGIGPQLSKQKQIEINKKVKKLIHYDCNNVGYEDEDIPAEDEVYIKENLLTRKGAENITEPADDLSIVNINVSVLYSSEGGEISNSNQTNNSNNSHANNNSKHSSHSNNGINSNISNSKNSVTYTYSSDSKKISASISNSKLSKNSAINSNGQNSSLQNRLGLEKDSYQVVNTSNTINTNNSNSKESSNKSDTKQIREVINKRKSLVEKQKKLGNKVLGNLIEMNSNTKKKENFNEIKKITVIESPEELLDTVPDLAQNKNYPNNVKITNITNIIVGTNSFDMKNMKTPSNDTMLRDIKALHLITQKALSTQSKHNPIDSIDDERRSFINFHNISSKKALFIEDNSDLPAGSMRNQFLTEHNYSRDSKDSRDYTYMNTEEEDKNKKQIINIININNNYNIGNINMTNISNKNIFTNMNNFSNSGSNSNQTKNSFRTVSIGNYKKNLSKIQNNINNSNITGNNTNLNVTNEPSMDGKSNISNKTLKKLIPKNSGSGNTSTTTKTLKDIIRSVKSDNRAKEKFIKLTGFK